MKFTIPSSLARKIKRNLEVSRKRLAETMLELEPLLNKAHRAGRVRQDSILEKGRRAQIGEVRIWKDGKKYRKKKSGVWEQVKEATKSSADKVAKTLHRCETEIMGLDHEEAFIINSNGDIAHRLKGSADRVGGITADMTENNVFTHNHPGGRCYFSEEDVDALIRGNCEEMRAVTRDGRFVSLRRLTESADKNFWYAAMDYLGDWNSICREADKLADAKYGQNKWTREQVEKELTNAVNNWFYKNAENYGYKLTEGYV
jgi:proteasome lid subunit RPN8/RPN11